MIPYNNNPHPTLLHTVLSVTVLTLLLWSILPSTLWACSCTRTNPMQDYKDTDLIILGEVVEIRVGERNKTAVFKLEKVWKGGQQNEISFPLKNGIGDCSISFGQGRKYLVYAWKSKYKEEYYSSICSGTRYAKHAGAKIIVLDILEKGASDKQAVQSLLTLLQNHNDIDMRIQALYLLYPPDELEEGVYPEEMFEILKGVVAESNPSEGKMSKPEAQLHYSAVKILNRWEDRKEWEEGREEREKKQEAQKKFDKYKYGRP